MKNLLITLTLLLVHLSLTAQVEWHEHYSHDRTTYGHLGQFIQNDQVVLIMGNWHRPMNTLETIEGRKKKEYEVISEYNEHLKVKTTQVEADHKEVLLLMAWDYDIPGIGAYSVRQQNDAIQIRNILNFNDEWYFINDAFIPMDTMEHKLCLTSEDEFFTLDNNDNVLNQETLEVPFSFHETSNGLYRIQNGMLEPFDTTTVDPCQLDLNDFDRILNDPYTNTTAILNGTEMHRYDLNSCTLVRTDQLSEAPGALTFKENGFYYLIDNEESATIYLYHDDTQTSEVWYSFTKDQSIGIYRVSNFEIVGDDVYFFGSLSRSKVNSRFNYVQRRNRNDAFAPKRKDLQFDSLYVTGTPSGSDPWDFWTYEYFFQVTNNSPDTVYEFSVMSRNLRDLFSFQQFLVFESISTVLPPGETYEGNGTFNFYETALLSLTIEGADFGLDSDFSNNSITADIKTLSTDNAAFSSLKIIPNPTSSKLNISGIDGAIESVQVINAQGRQFNMNVEDSQVYDVSDLPSGVYWIQIKTKDGTATKSFVKY